MRTIVDRGVYTVVPLDEFIVVNGVVASPFAYWHAAASLYHAGPHTVCTGTPCTYLSPWCTRADSSLRTVCVAQVLRHAPLGLPRLPRAALLPRRREGKPEALQYYCIHA